MRKAIKATFFLLPLIAHAAPVLRVIDGDTLIVGYERVRLANIDAPEKRQAYGHRSKQSLYDLCIGKDADLDMQTKDRYGRTVAVVYCDGINANLEQVKRGMAWVYTRYNKNPALPGIEADARNGERGLWADPAPVKPWLWRKHKISR